MRQARARCWQPAFNKQGCDGRNREKQNKQAVALHTELPKRSVNAKNGVSTASIDDFMTTGGSYWPGPGTNAVLAAATSSRVVDDLNGTNDGLAAPNALPRL